VRTFLDFFQLREQPFGDTPAARFLYASRTHREALASLIWGIKADRGFIGLVAKPGMGKTTLLFQLLEDLNKTASTAFVFQTQCDAHEMMQYLLLDLGLTPKDGNARMHLQMKQFLADQAASGRRVVLIVDEAQNLQEPVLETLRLISNFETESKKLVQLVLAGQPHLAERLALPSMEQLRQRMGVLARLEALGPDEAGEYIAHRLRVAGHPTGNVFTAGATNLIAQASTGIPREINTVAFNALSIAFALKRGTVDEAVVREVLADKDFSCLMPGHTESLTQPVPLFGGTHKVRRSWRFLSVIAQAAMVALLGLAVGLAVYHNNSRNVGTVLRDHSQSIPQEARVISVPVEASAVPVAETPQKVPARTGELKTAIASPSITVHAGQTLYAISREYLGRATPATVQEICDLNPNLSDPDHIEAGNTIQLPLSSGQRSNHTNSDHAVQLQLSTTRLP
jgi:type II secretory pathway predicted ATPase ExeA/LysM repeat protein